MNYQKKGLKRLLNAMLDGSVGRLVIVHKLSCKKRYSRNIAHMNKNNISGTVKVIEIAKWFDSAVSKVKRWFCR